MDPRLCARGCEFFGSSATQNLCSKCYKDYLKEEEEEETAAAAAANIDFVLALPAPSRNIEFSGSEAANTSAVVIDSSSPAIMIRNRCQSCKKKFGVMGFSCRCGGMFCGIHRYPEEHACKIDFKISGRVLLAKENPVIKADKLGSRV